MEAYILRVLTGKCKTAFKRTTRKLYALLPKLILNYNLNQFGLGKVMRKQKGILSTETDPFIDADVIVTAAIIGHSIRRLHKNSVNECKYSFEVEFKKEMKGGEKVETTELKSLKKTQETWHGMEAAINKINKVIITSRKMDLKGVTIGHTPRHDIADGKIIGDTGDKEPWSSARFEPLVPNLKEMAKFFIEMGNKNVYQGNGAYTGFVFNRAKDLPLVDVMPTIRITLPNAKKNYRWQPNEESFTSTPNKDDTESLLGPVTGNQAHERTWGMIGDQTMQFSLLNEYMQFYPPEPVPGEDIVGYTHGMIRAIYEIEECKLSHPGRQRLDYGLPHEVAVGKKTTKLGSCFACTTFMEANGYPASATHLGKCASWAIQYPVVGDSAHKTEAMIACNKKWSEYCSEILFLGVEAISKSNRIVDSHSSSLLALHKYLYSPQDCDAAADLILDAITIHEKDFQRVNRTLKSV